MFFWGVTVKHSKTVKLMNLMIRFHFEDVIFAPPFQPVSDCVRLHDTSVARLTSPWSNGNSAYIAMIKLNLDASKALLEYHSEHTERQSRFRSSPHLTQSSQAVCVSLPGWAWDVISSGESSKQIHPMAPVACGWIFVTINPFDHAPLPVHT